MAMVCMLIAGILIGFLIGFEFSLWGMRREFPDLYEQLKQRVEDDS